MKPDETIKEKAVLILVQIDRQQASGPERREESSGLVDALGCDLTAVIEINVREPNANVLFGSGQLDRIDEIASNHLASLIIVDGALTPIQQRNLETRLGSKVIDRTGLILEIFGLRARSSEGKLQVELARVTYERSRLVRTWTHLERQRGGLGAVSGPGETQLEADRRMLDRVVKRLGNQLTQVRKTRQTQRSGRHRRGVPVIALAGYTNSGKSTLFNRLTEADVLAKDMPFATLDPTFREFIIDPIGRVALVDTVGFITDLPTDLIDAFRATLEEALQADLILHVRDVSSSSFNSQKHDVEQVLSRLEETSGDHLPPIIEVWNKSDLADEGVAERHLASGDADGPLDIIVLSAKTGNGLSDLEHAIAQYFADDSRRLKVRIPPEGGRVSAWLHNHGDIVDQNTNDDGSQEITVRLRGADFGRFVAGFPGLTYKDVEDVD